MTQPTAAQTAEVLVEVIYRFRGHLHPRGQEVIEEAAWRVRQHERPVAEVVPDLRNQVTAAQAGRAARAPGSQGGPVQGRPEHCTAAKGAGPGCRRAPDLSPFRQKAKVPPPGCWSWDQRSGCGVAPDVRTPPRQDAGRAPARERKGPVSRTRRASSGRGRRPDPTRVGSPLANAGWFFVVGRPPGW
jgi:hypothetical protein